MHHRLSPRAEQDLDEIWTFVADDANVDASDRLIDAIVERCAMLVAHPKIRSASSGVQPGCVLLWPQAAGGMIARCR